MPVSGTRYQVKDVARLAKVTVRTLHHYDEIGLLVPSDRTDGGYRVYDDDDLLRLQQILIWRELGLPLERIRQILGEPGFDRRAALLEQRRRLLEQTTRTEAMVRSADAALDALKGDSEMSAKEIFDGFAPQEYKEEVKRRWGGTDAYRESARRTRSYTAQDWARTRSENENLMTRLADKSACGVAPDHESVTALAEEHRLHIDRWYYPCDQRMHAGLAEMYQADERFAAAFEKYGKGLAAYTAEAIRCNARGR